MKGISNRTSRSPSAEGRSREAVNFLLAHAVAVLAAVAFGVGLAGLASRHWKLCDHPTAGTSTRA